ncbi:MAG: hypothetical protein U1E54_03305 [Candidatus Levybacteria bacterium]|nr:hypothetical protein [Candidatus Levybacteria bacterium]
MKMNCLKLDLKNLKTNAKKTIAGVAVGLATLIVGGVIVNDATTNEISQTKLETKFNASQEIKAKYQIDGGSLKIEAKSNPKDRIEVVVGDVNATDFIPKVKIARWDDEVSLTLTPKMEVVATKDKDLTFVGDKIKYTNGTKSAIEMYDLPVSELNPEGGYEIEWILNEKPITNIVEFDIETQGLDFFYQPALTQAEIDEGASRPPEVIGSYAVYASENKTNYVGGKEYKTGKVGHIYRPKIIDSAGTEVWGDLHIENGILSVTIPQDFLDKAVYPVRHAAGLTFGYASVGVSLNGTSNYFRGNKYTAPASVTITSFSAAYSMGSANRNTVIAIYDNSSPAGLVSYSVEDDTDTGSNFAAESDHFTTLALAAGAGSSLVNGTVYRVVIGLTADSYVRYDAGAATTYKSSTTRPPPATLAFSDSGWGSNSTFSIYATYTADAAAEAPTYNQPRVNVQGQVILNGQMILP